MKKYFMITITVVMLLITIAAYKYENNIQVPQITQPSISIDSQRFGLIKKIVWTSHYINDDKSLLILSTRNTKQGEMSYLYHLNIDTGNAKILAEFPTHKNLNNVILFDSNFSSNSIVVAYDKGIIKIICPSPDINSPIENKIEIADFDKATSMDFKGNLIYTCENDNLLYVKYLYTGSFNNFFNNTNFKDLSTYYAKPLYVASLDFMNNVIGYTSVKKNQINFYAMKDSVPLNVITKPIIENVVSVQGIGYNFDFGGMNILNGSQSNKLLNLFILRNILSNEPLHSLDTFPYNTDSFGAIPSVDSTTNRTNGDISLIYTSYDENSKGTIKICSINKEPEVILSDENIFGPINVKNFENIPHILYFTLENNNVKIKICDEKGTLVKDLTDMIIKSNPI